MKRIALNGIKGWESRKDRAKKKRLFRTSQESMSGRIWKKTVGKTNWFRSRKKTSKAREKKKG